MENYATLTAEVKAEIETLVEAANNSEFGVMITAARYAVKGNFVFDKEKGFLPIRVTRYIRNYGRGIASVDDVVDDCCMFDKDAIVKAGLTPVAQKDISNHGKITKFVIDDKNGRRTYIAE